LGLIYTLSSGAPASITSSNMLYGNGVPDIVHPVDFNKLKGVRWGIRNTPTSPFLEGRYFDNNDVFVGVDDPQCARVAQIIRSRCTLNALAMVVPAETPDSFTLPDGRTAQLVLQHPQPGQRGTLGTNSVIGMGTWRLDANLGKTFQISESKSFTVRFDAQNVLNHPQPGNPVLNINAQDALGNPTPFGQITTKTGGRSLQGQLRLNF